MLKAYYNINVIEAGLDEVGRGCLAGPVVAAAVILPQDYTHAYLNDSKQLTRSQRLELETEIVREALAWAVAEVDNLEIDRINILKASFLAMHRAVDKLTHRPEHLLVDGNRFTPYPMIPHTCIIKGDAHYLSIAAASVLAKNYRDELMSGLSQQYPHYGWETNVGYPTIHHRRAIGLHGPCPYHRMTFRLLKAEETGQLEEETEDLGFL
ncbi:ribonuclease HII [Dyadobacter sandarakinus]|uniref:Ribonuclease HII n=1 Tax=Dyadobacter sandarakinus TaxID=2747268 RepID=A0ABX7IBS5_9BACT|nr:ribonuclease HII [Dyadobacter sandarakinus]QRR02907.1 ribonuclease HII [Dyadobacter sandarakinus]